VFKHEYYRYVPNFDSLLGWIAETLDKGGLSLHATSRHSDIEHILDAGEIIKHPNVSLDLFLATGAVDTRALAEIWVLLVQRGTLGVLIHPGMSEDAAKLVALTFASVPFITIEAVELPNVSSIDQIVDFPRFRAEIARLLQTVTFPQSVELTGVAPGVSPLPTGIDALARTGGEQFQAPAISLLHTLGAPEVLPKEAYCPDGILLLPDGFWLVDTKSSIDGFKFSVPEREKSRRYVRTFEEKQDSSSDWTFFGEIILTRTDVLGPQTIRRARDFLLAEDLRSSIVLMSYEGLSWLWEQAWLQPKYWRCCNIASDTRALMELHPVILNSIREDPMIHEFAESRVRVVSQKTFVAFREYVLGRKEYHELRARTPEDIATMVRRTLMNQFTRRRSPGVGAAVG
jgi:hypothetical protein